MIKGTTVYLTVKIQAGKDAFNRPEYSEKEIPVKNVLIGEPSANGIADSLGLEGKKIAYTLAIPKCDTNNWVDTKVRFFGEVFKTVGFPVEGIEKNIPGEWNKKVQVERYE